MDGLSLAASVIAAIQLAGSCLKLSRKWIGPSEYGSTDLTAMMTSLYGFNGAMKNFQTHMEIHEDDEGRLSSLEFLKPALERCEVALRNIKEFIEGTSFIGKHLIGPKFDRKLKTSLKALDGAKELFVLALHADQQAILLGVDRYVRDLADDLRDFHHSITTSLKRLHENGDATYQEVKRVRKEQGEWQHAASDMTSGIKVAIDRQDARGNSVERRAILDWLNPIDYASQQTDFISRRQAGTGQWLLNSEEYKTWVKTGHQTLFCPGIPGAGKTIFTAITIDDLTSRFQHNPNVGFGYIYCNFRRQHEQKATDLLMSLLRQLSQGRSPLPGRVRALYDQHKDKLTRPSFEEVSTTFRFVAAMYSRVFIIIDALDECQASDGCRSRLLAEIFNLQASSGANVFATSRFIPEITDKFEGCISLEIRASGEDVRKYLDSHMFRLPGFVGRNPELQEEIKTEIIRSVREMFLLAQLHLDSLIGKRSAKAIRAALAKLPTGSGAYDHAYKDAMDRINGQVKDQEELAKQVLSWITCAKRLLTIWELQHALAVEPGLPELDEENLPQIEDIVSVCAGLVAIDKESDIIRLVHYTTQEYFERTQQEWFPTAEEDIATTCVTYLSFNTFESGFCVTNLEFEERLQSNPLYDYAARSWGHHVLMASMEAEQSIFDLLESEPKVSACSQALMVSRSYLGNSQSVPRHITGLHFAALFGLKTTIRILLNIGYSPDPGDTSFRTPLIYAAEMGHEAVVRTLLGTGKVDIDSKDEDGRTPLSHAAERGHEDIVRTLLDTGNANADSKGEDDSTPLSYAAANGHEAIVRLLLDCGMVDANVKSSWGRTALSDAAENGHEAIVKLMLTSGIVEPDSKDEDGRTPLSHAAASGHTAVVRLLLDNSKVNADSKDEDIRTPLSHAAANGHEAIVRLLLDSGRVDADSRSSTGRTPLSYTTENGHEAIVSLLLSSGKVVSDSRSSSGWTPLSYAVGRGHRAIAKLLEFS